MKSFIKIKKVCAAVLAIILLLSGIICLFSCSLQFPEGETNDGKKDGYITYTELYESIGEISGVDLQPNYNEDPAQPVTREYAARYAIYALGLDGVISECTFDDESLVGSSDEQLTNMTLDYLNCARLAVDLDLFELKVPFDILSIVPLLYIAPPKPLLLPKEVLFSNVTSDNMPNLFEL